MNEFTKDFGKIGLTFKHYQAGGAVEKLTLVAYKGELYVSLRDTVMNDNIPGATSDWYKVSTYGELAEAIGQIKADSEQLKADIEAIKAEAQALLASMQEGIEAEIKAIDDRAKAIIAELEAAENKWEAAEREMKEAEQGRKEAERLREQAEDLRVAAENLRDGDEGDRRRAELARVNAEQARGEEWARKKTDIETTIQTATQAADRAVRIAQELEPLVLRAQEAVEGAEREIAKIGPAIEEMRGTFAADEQQRTQTFTQNEQQREQKVDAAVAEVVAAGGSSAVVDMSRDFGKYVQRPDVTLEVVQTGKRFTKDGEMVADANWNIGRIGSVERGLLYELLMGGSAKMVLGTALFVSHTVEKRGTQDVDIYTPVFSALGTALPVSNYAVLWAGENYSDLLVSYRADVAGANVMRVAEWGLFKSIATQYANLKAQVNLKSFADGYYAGMRVGTADNLTPRGEASEEMFMERVAGGTHAIEDGDAAIKTIKGKTLKAWQMWRNESGIMGVVYHNVRSYLTYTNTDRGVRMVANTATTMSNGLAIGTYQWINKVKGHKYLTSFYVKENTFDAHWYFQVTYYASELVKARSTGLFTKIFTVASDEDIAFYLSSQAERCDIGNVFEFEDWICLDLTALGIDNLTTVDQVAQYYGFGNWAEFASSPMFRKLMAYSEAPKLVPSRVEGVKTTGRNLWDETWDKGYWAVENGKVVEKVTSQNNRWSVNVEPNKKYYIYADFTRYVAGISIRFSNDSMDNLGAVSAGYNMEFTTPNGCTKLLMFYYSTGSAVPYANDICINISDASFNDQYEPYEVHERKWGETLKKYFPDGLKSVGNVFDVMTPTKATKRLVKFVFDGTESWAVTVYGQIVITPSVRIKAHSLTEICTASSSLVDVEASNRGSSNVAPARICINDATLDVRGTDAQVRGASSAEVLSEWKAKLAALKAAGNPLTVFAELETPEEYTYDELNLTERVFAGGMEQAIVPEGEESAPLVADIVYPIDAYNTIKSNKAKIEDLQQKPAISLTADEVTKLRALISAATQSEGGEL